MVQKLSSLNIKLILILKFLQNEEEKINFLGNSIWWNRVLAPSPNHPTTIILSSDSHHHTTPAPKPSPPPHSQPRHHCRRNTTTSPHHTRSHQPIFPQFENQGSSLISPNSKFPQFNFLTQVFSNSNLDFIAYGNLYRTFYFI